MHDGEKGGMGFYTLIESKILGESFYILDSNPYAVTIVNDDFTEHFVNKEALADELRNIAAALDEPLLG